MKFEKLEAIRGFAALYVVLYHLLQKVSYTIHGIDLLLPFRFGQEAVILFFLLSGFVIKYSFDGTRDKSFKSYFFKRFTRIYIPLFFVYIVSYLLKSAEAGIFINPNLPNLFGNIFMLQDVGGIKPNVLLGTYMGNLPLWSLSYEWWFYMLFYLLYKITNPKNIQICVVLLVLLSGISYVFYPFFLNRILFYFGIWWIGVELAKLYRSDQKIQFKDLSFSYFLLISSVVICAINCAVYLRKHHLSFGTSPVLELRHFAFSLLILTAAVIWYKQNWIGFDAIFKVFVRAAPISYTIYISHWVLLIDRSYLNFLSNKTVELIAAIFITVLFSFFIELIVYPVLRSAFYNKVFAYKLAKS